PFGLSGAPGGVTASFSPNPATSYSTLKLTDCAGTVARSYPLTITGVSGSLTHTTTVTLVVTAPPDFALSAAPLSQPVAAGGSTSYRSEERRVGEVSGSVQLWLNGAEGGVTAAVSRK